MSKKVKCGTCKHCMVTVDFDILNEEDKPTACKNPESKRHGMLVARDLSRKCEAWEKKE